MQTRTTVIATRRAADGKLKPTASRSSLRGNAKNASPEARKSEIARSLVPIASVAA